MDLYKELLYLGFFLTGLWVAGWACCKIKITPIVGQILFGLLLGPNGIGFVPLINGYEYLEQAIDIFQTATNVSDIPEPFNLKNTDLENFLVILGELGVTLLIFESGLHVDFATVRQVGPSAVMVAVLGTVFSITSGIFMGYLFGFDLYPEGLALGAVVAPTSVGIALKLLVDSNVLDSVFGQTIVTAAFTDDIFSLITLALLKEIAAGEVNAVTFLKPLGIVAAFIVISVFSALYLMPKVFPRFLNYFSTSRDYVHLICLFLLMALFGYAGTFVGSHLLGAFFAGIAVSKVPRTSQVWTNLVERESQWLLGLFFGASVAFKIPVDELLSFESFWKGFLLGLACILAKVLAGLPLKHRWIVGWAMVGRGEFSFLVGDILKTTDFEDTNEPFLSEEAFGIAVWALIIAIFVAPVAFEIVLQKQLEPVSTIGFTQGGVPSTHYIQSGKEVPRTRATNIVKSIISVRRKEIPRSNWRVLIKTKPLKNVISDVLTVFQELDAEVLFVRNSLTGTYEFHIMVVEPLSSITRDEYFEFNIDKYIERLRAQLVALFVTESTITIDRLAHPQAPNAGISDALSVLPSHEISFTTQHMSSTAVNKQRRNDLDEVSPIPP